MEIAVAAERSLVDRARDGDLDAFEQLVRERMDAVYRLTHAIVLDPADAADATQETFVAAWRQIRSLRDPARFDAWLQRIAVNLARFELLRHALRPMGLAEAHFGWSGRKLRLVSRWLNTLILIGLPAWFVVAAVSWSGDAIADSETLDKKSLSDPRRLPRCRFVSGVRLVRTTRCCCRPATTKMRKSNTRRPIAALGNHSSTCRPCGAKASIKSRTSSSEV